MYAVEFVRYISNFISMGGNRDNVKNMASHWLYGTASWKLAEASKRGIVYNPPGH